jgi:7-carboxy-7-deazaguanine synthase
MLKVNEIFGPTVQGEGKSAGKPTMFIRLAMCNLKCIWCDSPHTWNFYGVESNHPVKYDMLKEVDYMTAEQIYKKIEAMSNGLRMLVISGGEPLYQQNELIKLLRIFKANNWWVEVETNGTTIPRTELLELVDQINCSPKLANSENPITVRRQLGALIALARSPKVNFKFVTATEDDMTEILEIVNDILRPNGHKNLEVRLMPLCQTREELKMREPLVKRLCDEHGFIYTSRLSIELSGTKRGV